MKYFLIFVIIVYIVWPYDLIPDFLGLVGRLDDVLVAAYILYRWWHLFRDVEPQSAAGTSGQKVEAKGAEAKSCDPYEVLGVSRSASAEDITFAYRQRAAEYHPDKVNHLGRELRELAHKKMLEIQLAYEKLRGT